MSTFENRRSQQRKELILKEISYGNIKPLTWYRNGITSYVFEIEVDGKKERVNVKFQNYDRHPDEKVRDVPDYINSKNAWNVGYDIAGESYQYKKTSASVLFNILVTVVDIVKDFILHTKADYIFMFPSGEQNMVEKKKQIYSDIINSLSSTIPGYYGGQYGRGNFISKKQ
jgi:hypothetical protein